MFWRMAGLSTASPVETILEKENFTLEELLDEDEIIQECKALNSRLICFLRQRPQVEQLVRYIVEEGVEEDAEMKRTFKYPLVSCEIFTCEVDIILKTLVEDEELMNLLFSYLEPNRPHSTLLSGYFSKVVSCLLSRKTVALMQYIQGHQEVIKKLVDLIAITSIMEVLIRLIGADDHVYTNYTDAMKWLEDTNVLDMIVDKLTSSDSREVHANAAETLCAIIRYAPPGLAAKVSSPGFIGRLFCNALEESQPKSVLVNSLTVCISLLDPKRLTSGIYPAYGRQVSQASGATANPEIVEGMLESLGRLLEMLDLSSDRTVLLTTYGKLQPPLGKHRLKIIEFISVLLSTGSEAAENELVRLGAVSQMLDLFFKYPYNNSLHHHVETIITSCLESKNLALVQHILHDCNLVGRILEAEKHPTLTSNSDEPTVIVDGRVPWKIGNIGHLTRIANQLIHMGSTNEEIQTVLKKNNEWMQWQTNVLSERNAVENVQQWTCGRPTALQERSRDSDEDDYQDRDYDVAALANNLSQAFRYGIYSSDTDAVHGSLERDDEDVFFDDDASEVVLSSLRLGDDQEGGPIFTKTNWFAFEDDRTNDDSITSAPVSPSPDVKPISADSTGDDQVTAPEHEGTKASLQEQETSQELVDSQAAESSFSGSGETEVCEHDKPPEQVEWKETETATSDGLSVADKPTLSPNDTRGEETETQAADTSPPTNDPTPSADDELSQADANDTLNEAPQPKEGSSDPRSHPHSTPPTEDDKLSGEEGMLEP
ncbi:hypothetical protein Droror1_Dr00018368 [Drosera rotundifolia]